ncbi:hypothetical protein [Roseivirga seohaensis]|uniref:hypothetical protein n=1 Tax=Roseivirga seohaensis TaxID=1914963 RepID=UPI003BAA679E
MKELQLKKGVPIHKAPVLVQKLCIHSYCKIPVTIGFLDQVQKQHPDYFIDVPDPAPMLSTTWKPSCENDEPNNFQGIEALINSHIEERSSQLS